MRSLVTGGAGFIGSHVARHCLRRGDEVTVLDDLSGGFADHVPKGCRFVEGSVTDAPLATRLFDEGRFDYVYHLAAYAAEGLSHFIRRFNYTNNVVGSVTIDQRVGEARREVLRLHVLDRRLRRRAAPDARGHGAAARGSLRRREVRRRARPARRPRDVRTELRDLPAPQRVRREPEHRRPVPQRHRHLHESDHAGQADDDLRRRRADAGLQPHRRRGAADRGERRGSRGLRAGRQHRRRRALHGQPPRRGRREGLRRGAEASSTSRRATRSSTRTRTIRGRAASSGTRRPSRSRTASGAWPSGRGASARARASRSATSRFGGTSRRNGPDSRISRRGLAPRAGRPLVVWCLLRDQRAHVESVERHFGGEAEFVYDAAWDPAALLAGRPDLVLCVNDYHYDVARCLDAARGAGIPSLVLQDGILEWRCQYENPLFGSRRGRAAASARPGGPDRLPGALERRGRSRRGAIPARRSRPGCPGSTTSSRGPRPRLSGPAGVSSS